MFENPQQPLMSLFLQNNVILLPHHPQLKTSRLLPQLLLTTRMMMTYKKLSQ
jgi:hypothetical protein